MARATRSSASPQISSSPAAVRVSVGEQIKVALDWTKDAWADLVGEECTSVLKDWQFTNMLRIEDKGALYPTTLKPDEAQNFNAVLWYADLVPMWKWVLSTIAVRGPADLGLHDLELEYQLMAPASYVIRDDWHLYVADWDEKSGGVFWERCKAQLKHHPAWTNFMAAYNNACDALGLASDTSMVSIVDEAFQDAPKPKSPSTTYNANNGRTDDGGDGAAAVTEDADDEDDEWEEHDGDDQRHRHHDGRGYDDVDGEEEEEEDWTEELSDEEQPTPEKETKGKKRRRSNKWSHSKRKPPSAPAPPHMFSYCSPLHGGSSRRSKVMSVRGAASNPTKDTHTHAHARTDVQKRGSSSTSAGGGGSASSSATVRQALKEQEPKTNERRMSPRFANHDIFSSGAATSTTTSQASVAAAVPRSVPGHAPIAAPGVIGGVGVGGGGSGSNGGGGRRRGGLRKQSTGAAPAGTAIEPDTVIEHHTHQPHTPAAAADRFPPSSSTLSVGEGYASGMTGSSASHSHTSPASTITETTAPSPPSPPQIASTHPCTTTTSAPTRLLPQAPVTAFTAPGDAAAASHGTSTCGCQPLNAANAHSSCSINAPAIRHATADSQGAGGGGVVADSGLGGFTTTGNGGGDIGDGAAIGAAVTTVPSVAAAAAAATMNGSVKAEEPSSMDGNAYEDVVGQELLKALAVDATAALDAYQALLDGDVKVTRTVRDCRAIGRTPHYAANSVLLRMFRKSNKQ